MKTESFNYELPSSLIAQTPIKPRHDSRLLVYERASGMISEGAFKNLRDFLIPGDLLVINRTKVIPARIFGQKRTGGKVEVLLLKKLDDRTWEVLIGGKNIIQGKQIQFTNNLSAEVLEELPRSKRIIQFTHSVESFLREFGQMPLPPYIHEKLEDQDRYQTVYAQEEGSAAAPTAGLHFTDELMAELIQFGAQFAEITLHIGLDTFVPVTEEDIEKHIIHTEWCRISAEEIIKINCAMEEQRRVIAVGTTSVRTLETAHRYRSLNGTLLPFEGPTDLFILPGFKFKIVDAIITNFHLPRSTLLMLVSAFAGLDNIKRCYQYAVQEQFRFYSFGDAMLII